MFKVNIQASGVSAVSCARTSIFIVFGLIQPRLELKIEAYTLLGHYITVY
jgi:hypothetical protein